MPDPTFALLVGLALLALVAALCWPVHGLLWRVRKRSRVRPERVLTEDALKHFYDAEYRGAATTLHSLAGALELGGDRAARLLERLVDADLVHPDGDAYRLTDDGRRDALRVLRSHRLWERYLSDTTGFPPTEWHPRADTREHELDPAAVDDLARRMGEPRYDPHGDPIPTADGEVPPPFGIPLPRLEPGTEAEIVHVEDEPAAVYAELVARHLQPGTRIRLLDSSTRAVVFADERREHVLPPVIAANLTVRPTSGDAELPRERLVALEVGESARVAGIAPTCRGPERRRLLDLGLVPGTLVTAELRAPGGDPTAYRVRGAVLALRRAQAEAIHIKRTVDRGTDTRRNTLDPTENAA